MQRNRFDAYFWCRVERYGEVLTMLMDDPCGKEGEWQPRTLQTQFHLVHQQTTRRKTATRWVSMSKNLPMFCNCPWILPRWARSGGIEEIGGTTGGMMGAGGPVTRWISDQWGDGLRKDVLIDLQDVWWKYWKWVLFRIHMNQGEACTSHGIIYLNYFGMFLLGWTPFITFNMLQLCCWNRSSHQVCWSWCPDAACALVLLFCISRVKIWSFSNHKTALCAKISLGPLNFWAFWGWEDNSWWPGSQPVPNTTPPAMPPMPGTAWLALVRKINKSVA